VFCKGKLSAVILKNRGEFEFRGALIEHGLAKYCGFNFFLVKRKPSGNGDLRRFLGDSHERNAGHASFADLQDVSDNNMVRRDGGALTVNQNVSMSDQLAGFAAGFSKAEAEDGVVEAGLKLNVELFGGISNARGNLLHIRRELLLRETVNVANFLLFAKLEAIFGYGTAVLPFGISSSRGISLAAEGAFRGKTPFTFEEKLFACASADFTFFIHSG